VIPWFELPFSGSKAFAFLRGLRQAESMTKPLALVFYEALLPGSQLVNRLQDLGYQVLTHSQASSLVAQVKESRPFLLVMDLVSQQADLCQVIRELRQAHETNHIPVLAFAKEGQEKLREDAHAAGATLVAGDVAVLSHLPQLLERVLEVSP
jgi:CheY-like chemotaxis protein